MRSHSHKVDIQRVDRRSPCPCLRRLGAGQYGRNRGFGNQQHEACSQVSVIAEYQSALTSSGALLLGTVDGANVEIAEDAGEDQCFMFGHLADQVQQVRDSASIQESIPE